MDTESLLLTYITVTTMISFIALKFTKSAKSFFTAQGELSVFLLIPLVFSEVTAGAGTIGSAQLGYSLGMSAVWAKAGMSVGFILFGLYIAKFFFVVNRRMGVISVAQAFAERFDDRSRFAMMLITALSYMIIFSIQPIAGAMIIAPIFGISISSATWGIGVVFCSIALLGGFKGVAWMNLVHATIMFFGIIFVSLKGIGMAGGIDGMKAVLPATMFSVVQPNYMTVTAWIVAAVISVFTATSSVTAVFGAKSLKAARYGTAVAGLMMIPFAFILVMAGMAAKVLYPDIPSGKALFAIANHTGDVGLGIVCIAIAAAIFSTGPAYILFPVTTLVRDLYVPLINKQSSDKMQMMVSKVLIVIVGLGCTYLGTKASTILGSVLSALQIRSVASIILIMGLLIPKLSSDGAFWSLILSGIVSFVWYVCGNPFGIEPLWPGMLTIFPVAVFYLLRTKEPMSSGYVRYLDACSDAQRDGQI